jgi:transcriptional regulator with XRE-family HTH domain
MRVHSPVGRDAALYLGQQIKLARKSRRMTQAMLAERCGISRSTVRAMERRSLTVQIGLVFEAATIVGVRLFGLDRSELVVSSERIDGRIALLPKRIRAEGRVVKGDF